MEEPDALETLLPAGFAEGLADRTDGGGSDDEDWQQVGRGGKVAATPRDALWQSWLQGGSHGNGEHEIWSWPRKRRLKFAERLCADAHQRRVDTVTAHFERLSGLRKEKRTLEEVATVNVLKASKLVIGCTTSGAAKYQCAHCPAVQAMPTVIMVSLSLSHTCSAPPERRFPYVSL